MLLFQVNCEEKPKVQTLKGESQGISEKELKFESQEEAMKELVLGDELKFIEWLRRVLIDKN